MPFYRRPASDIGRRTRNAKIQRKHRLNRNAEERLTYNANLRDQTAKKRANESQEQRNERLQASRQREARRREARRREAHRAHDQHHMLSEENVSEDGQCGAMLGVQREDSESTDCCMNSDLPGARTVYTETPTSSPQLQIIKVKDEPCDNFEDRPAEFSQNFVQSEHSSDNAVLREQAQTVLVKTEGVGVNAADFVFDCSADFILKAEEIDLGCDCIENSNGPIHENSVEYS